MFRWYSPLELLSLVPFLLEFVSELRLEFVVEVVPGFIDLGVDFVLDQVLNDHRCCELGRSDRYFLFPEAVLGRVCVNDGEDDLGNAGSDDEAGYFLYDFASVHKILSGLVLDRWFIIGHVIIALAKRVTTRSTYIRK